MDDPLSMEELDTLGWRERGEGGREGGRNGRKEREERERE